VRYERNKIKNILFFNFSISVIISFFNKSILGLYTNRIYKIQEAKDHKNLFNVFLFEIVIISLTVFFVLFPKEKLILSLIFTIVVSALYS
jgi:hypothetical protein